MRVLVCGGRAYPNRVAVYEEMDWLNGHAREPITQLVHGDAGGLDKLGRVIGADQIAGQWAVLRGIEERKFPAEWNRHGKAAGPLRNQQMIDEAKPHLVVAFPGGNGTADMARRAERAGVPVLRLPRG